ncbi:MAG: hypothetical protein Q7R41_17440 [Phycisphaerales bacterium]|nr:hypothetical protein [Phycisphaerales bacterium]
MKHAMVWPVQSAKTIEAVVIGNLISPLDDGRPLLSAVVTAGAVFVTVKAVWQEPGIKRAIRRHRWVEDVPLFLFFLSFVASLAAHFVYDR